MNARIIAIILLHSGVGSLAILLAYIILQFPPKIGFIGYSAITLTYVAVNFFIKFKHEITDLNFWKLGLDNFMTDPTYPMQPHIAIPYTLIISSFTLSLIGFLI